MTRAAAHPVGQRVWKRLDSLRGLDFDGTVELPEHSDLQVRCAPSGGHRLLAVLAAESIAPTDRILDVGCGKGSAMRTLQLLPFAEVAGLELSPQLAEIASDNFARVDRAGRTTVIVADATEFDGYDRFSHLYLYNPFLGEVFEAFSENLGRSLARAPRDLTVIYLFPRCHDALMATGLFAEPELHPGPHGKELAVYRHRRSG